MSQVTLKKTTDRDLTGVEILKRAVPALSGAALTLWGAVELASGHDPFAFICFAASAVVGSALMGLIGYLGSVRRRDETASLSRTQSMFRCAGDMFAGANVSSFAAILFTMGYMQMSSDVNFATAQKTHAAKAYNMASGMLEKGKLKRAEAVPDAHIKIDWRSKAVPGQLHVILKPKGNLRDYVLRGCEVGVGRAPKMVIVRCGEEKFEGPVGPTGTCYQVKFYTTVGIKANGLQ